MTQEQIDRADLLAENLRDCGHDVTAWDLLDCLASVGLMLALDEKGIASAAYFATLTGRREESEGAAQS